MHGPAWHSLALPLALPQQHDVAKADMNPHDPPLTEQPAPEHFHSQQHFSHLASSHKLCVCVCLCSPCAIYDEFMAPGNFCNIASKWGETTDRVGQFYLKQHCIFERLTPFRIAKDMEHVTETLKV